MCGRIIQSSPVSVLTDRFQLDHAAQLPLPRFNIPPSTDIAAVRLDPNGRRELVMLKWGFVPHWAKDLSGIRPINARAETISDKPMFREAFKRHRCLVPVDGFYEWQASPQGKQPFCYRRADGQPFALGGIWSHWRGEAGDLETVSIVVTAANALMTPVHDRVPVILTLDHEAQWLAPGTLDEKTREHLLAPPDPAGYVLYAVSRAVNRPGHDTADLLEPV